MNLNTLKYFRVLGRLEHYGKTAKELHIAQPALSNAIHQMENDLGTRLFDRRGRNVQLTKWGKVYWQKVEEALTILDLAEKSLKQWTRNEITIGFSYSLGDGYAPSLMREFLSIPGNGHIHFSTTQGISDELIDKLKNDQCDVVLTLLVNSTQDIEFIPIFRQEIVVIVANEHPLAQKKSVELPEIFEYPLIYPAKHLSFHKELDSFFAEFGVTPNIAYEVEEDLSYAGMVEANMGIALIANERILNAFDIKILPITNKVYERYFYLAYLKDRFRTEPVSKFISYIIKNKSIKDPN